MARKLENWIDGFLEYVAPLPSPNVFKKWAAIATIAGALERKVWVVTKIATLYPNLYTILVAPPGVGKTILSSRVWAFWHELSDGTSSGMFIAQPSITSAALIDELKDAERKILRLTDTPPMVTFNALAIASNELGVLLPEYASEFMASLTDLYDGHPYGQRRRTKDLNFSIDKPILNIIASCTPGYLASTMPEGAWDQGFLSRTILVFSSEVTRRSIFGDEIPTNGLYDKLQHDLRIIFSLFGKMKFEEEAAKQIDRWQMQGGPPAPDHPKLANYNTRRTAHLIKLSMVHCAAEGDRPVITTDHVERALDALLEAEQLMPDIFKAMAVGGDQKAMVECWHFVYKAFMREAEPVKEARIIDFLRERVPAQNVLRILDVMVRGGLLIEQVGKEAGAHYKPRPRKES